MSSSWELLRKKLNKLAQTRGFKANLARKMGIPASLVHRYLEGSRTPGIDQLDKFAVAMEVKPWELIKPDHAIPTPYELEDPLLLEFILAWKKLDQVERGFIVRQVNGIVQSRETVSQDGKT